MGWDGTRRNANLGSNPVVCCHHWPRLCKQQTHSTHGSNLPRLLKQTHQEATRGPTERTHVPCVTFFRMPCRIRAASLPRKLSTTTDSPSSHANSNRSTLHETVTVTEPPSIVASTETAHHHPRPCPSSRPCRTTPYLEGGGRSLQGKAGAVHPSKGAGGRAALALAPPVGGGCRGGRAIWFVGVTIAIAAGLELLLFPLAIAVA